MGGANGYFSDSDVLLQLGLQTGWGVVPTSGIVVPIKDGSTGPKHEQDLKPNEARFQNGYKRPGVLGLPSNGAELPLVTNLGFLGYPLYGFIGSSMAETVTVVRINIDNAGTGYADGPVVVTIAAPGGGGTTATATAVAAGGKVTTVTIAIEGSGYTLGAPPAVTFAAPGGGGTTATGTAIVREKHSGKPKPGVLPFYTIEDAVGTGIFYRYPNQVFTEFRLEYDLDGAFDPTFVTMGGGDPVGPYVASIDATPTEVTGAPASKLNWSTIEDGVDAGIISKASLTFKRAAVDVKASGSLGVSRDLFGGSIDVTGTVTVLFKGDSRLAQARNGTLTSQKYLITRGDDSIVVTMPEVQAKPKTEIKKDKDKPLSFDLEITGTYDTNVNSPVFFELYNTIATHATT
jgi:hypothetical protein